MKIHLVALRKVWFAASVILVVGSIAAIATWGLRLGIDFTGGSLMNFGYANRPSIDEISQAVAASGADVGEPVIQPVGETDVQIRTKTLSQPAYEQVVTALKANHPDLVEQQFNSVGPVIGQELRQKAVQGIVVALVLIFLYIAYMFRKVSAPVASWKYGIATLVSALHDIVIPIGVFAFLGHYYNVSVGTPFVAAILTILGYSITDTIVVADRIRENLPRMKAPFDEVVEFSLHQTALRSVYTSVTTLISLLAIFFFGGSTLHEFTLAMIIGILVGTYSSIFVSPMLLVGWNHWSQSRKPVAAKR